MLQGLLPLNVFNKAKAIAKKEAQIIKEKEELSKDIDEAIKSQEQNIEGITKAYNQSMLNANADLNDLTALKSSIVS